MPLRARFEFDWFKFGCGLELKYHWQFENVSLIKYSNAVMHKNIIDSLNGVCLIVIESYRASLFGQIHSPSLSCPMNYPVWLLLWFLATLVFRALTHQPVNLQPARYFFQFLGLIERLSVWPHRACDDGQTMWLKATRNKQLPRHQRESSALLQEWLANLGHHWARIMHTRSSLSMAPLTGLTSFHIS